MRIAIIGTGYVGLVTGAGFADYGNQVTCVDLDEAKIAGLGDGKIPIYEPGLEPIVRRNIDEGRLSFTTKIADAVAGAEVVFLAVGTPSLPDGSADISQVLAAAVDTGKALTGFTVVVNKSTVPVGTAAKVAEAVGTHAKHRFAVASNPEFLKEGDAVSDFMNPDRVIIGTDDKAAEFLLCQLYEPFTRTGEQIVTMDARSAELTKYAANAFLATRISFMNEIANLCERVGADVEYVRRGMGLDQRIGTKFLFAGIGYGGSCFPKDVKALLYTARKYKAPLGVVECVHDVNERQKSRMVEKIKAHFGSVDGKVVALWGLAFKPGTDDIREAPALVVIEQLLAAGAKVRAFDPAATENVRRIFGDRVQFHDDEWDAASGADAVALLTEWPQFHQIDMERLRGLMRGDVVFDGRNIWDPSETRAAGLTYHGMGRR